MHVPNTVCSGLRRSDVTKIGCVTFHQLMHCASLFLTAIFRFKRTFVFFFATWKRKIQPPPHAPQQAIQSESWFRLLFEQFEGQWHKNDRSSTENEDNISSLLHIKILFTLVWSFKANSLGSTGEHFWQLKWFAGEPRALMRWSTHILPIPLTPFMTNTWTHAAGRNLSKKPFKPSCQSSFPQNDHSAFCSHIWCWTVAKIIIVWTWSHPTCPTLNSFADVLTFLKCNKTAEQKSCVLLQGRAETNKSSAALAEPGPKKLLLLISHLGFIFARK